MTVDNRFSAAPETLEVDAMLFDMDGTLIDSTNAIVKYWRKMGKELGVDGDEILKTSHGRRSIDLLRLYDPSRANWDYIQKMEGSIPKEYGEDAVELPGARALLEDLEAASAPWAIVTSGTKPLVSGWLEIMKLAMPRVLVTAEDVEEGKPNPACYRLGRVRLGLSEKPSTTGKALPRALVLEDAPSGVRAGKDSGAMVCAVATSHSVEQLREAGPDWIVQDLRSVQFRGWNRSTATVTVEILNAFRP